MMTKVKLDVLDKFSMPYFTRLHRDHYIPPSNLIIAHTYSQNQLRIVYNILYHEAENGFSVEGNLSLLSK